MVAVEEAFIQKFGQYAGWAHNVLFISDLASSKTHLPEHLWPKTQGKSEKIKKRKSDPELESKDSIKWDAIGIGMIMEVTDRYSSSLPGLWLKDLTV